MADENTDTASDTATDPSKWIATLKSGNIYVYGGEAPFYKDIPSKPISDELKQVLEAEAVEIVNVTIGQDMTAETRQKFVFEPAPATKATRTRAKAQ